LNEIKKDKTKQQSEKQHQNNGHSHNENHKFRHILKPLEGSTKVEPFFVDNKLVTQISDHYAIRSELEVICIEN